MTSTRNYEALCRAYDELDPFSQKQRWEFDSNLVHLNFLTKYLPKDGTILDAGSYIGILALALRFLGYNVEGSDKYLFIPNNTYFVGDLEQLKSIWARHNLSVLNQDVITDAPIKKYDAVLSVAVIEHQRYPRLFLDGLKRCVKPGGFIYVATPNLANLANRFRFLLGRPPVQNIERLFKDAEEFNGHWREYTPQELKSVFKLSGLSVVASKTCQSMRPNWKSLGKLPLNLTRLIARLLPSTGDTNLIVGKVQ